MNKRALRHVLWIVPALPGLYQLWLLLYTVARRFPYPYDLEWMEGGMLTHALRLGQGHSIYAPPSLDFIPYLYTPIYPALLAGLAKIIPLSYQLGRAISVASILAIVGFGYVALADKDRPPRSLVFVGGSIAAGFFAATYPWVEGWYDLVRGDTLFLAVGVGGLVALRAWAHSPKKVAAAAAILALSFFIKQTGVLLVAAGGVALLVMNWRATPIYVAVAGAIGGGGTWLLTKLTGGWFWIYVFKYHQQHDTNMDRFGRSFVNILWQFPALSITLLAILIVVGSYASMHRRLPPGGARFLYWLWMFAAGTVIGALGWATQWAHFNAYIPAMTFGGIAAGAGLIAFAGVFHDLPVRLRATEIAAVLVAAVLGWQLWHARWKPRDLMPTIADRDAGDRLIAHLRTIDGDIFVPSHPWYAYLAGKKTFTHRMGILDVTYEPPLEAKKPKLPPRAKEVDGLANALRTGAFAAVVLDDHYGAWELPGLSEGYRSSVTLPANESPHVFTGAKTVPHTIWTPIANEPPPPGATVLFDFEAGTYQGWDVSGTAWGTRPVQDIPGREVGGYRGRWFASSYNAGGLAATGTLMSPPFEITGKKLLFRIGGGSDPRTEHVDLILDATGEVVLSATGPKSSILVQRFWDVTPFAGQKVRLALVDEGTGGWDYLLVDDVLLEDR